MHAAACMFFCFACAVGSFSLVLICVIVRKILFPSLVFCCVICVVFANEFSNQWSPNFCVCVEKLPLRVSQKH